MVVTVGQYYYYYYIAVRPNCELVFNASKPQQLAKKTNTKISTYHIIIEARRWSGRVKKIATDSVASQEATRDFLDPSESLKSTKLKYCRCLKPVDSTPAVEQQVDITVTFQVYYAEPILFHARDF